MPAGLMVMVVLAMVVPEGAAFETGESSAVRKLAARYETALKAADGRALAEALLATPEPVREEHVTALGQAVARAGAHETVARMVDALRARRDGTADLLAGDVLLATVRATELGNFGPTKAILEFPADLCDRAAALLDHPDPVVQAMGDWALSLRVRGQNSAARRVRDFFRPSAADARWHARWLARSTPTTLRDDYARQLIQEGHHRSLAGAETAVNEIERRRQQMAADGRSRRDAGAESAQAMADAAARKAIETGDLAAAHRAILDLRLAGRAAVIAARPEFPREGIAFFTNPTITNGQWNVNVAVTGSTNLPAGTVLVKRSADPAGPARSVLPPHLVGQGSVRGLDLDWEGRLLLLSFWHQPTDAKNPIGWTARNAFLYRVDVDGGGWTQLTGSPGSNDIEPCFLPDGGIVFASDRSSFGNQCAGPFLQDKRCTTLFRQGPEAGAEPIAISNNKDFDRHPHVLNDGTVVFMHWEYQERGLYATHAVWRCRPDGTNMDAFFKQHLSEPMSIRDVRQSPDSGRCFATVQGHHSPSAGPIVVFDPSRGINNEEAMWIFAGGAPVGDGNRIGALARQRIPEGGVANPGGTFANPFPLSDKAVLAAHDMAGNLAEFAIHYVDAWGNRELIHRDPEMSAFYPLPLRARQRPPVVADTVDPKLTYATTFLENVYRDLPGVAPGAVKYLRLSQSLPLPAPVDPADPQLRFNHLHWLPGDATASHFGYWSWSPSRVIGHVKVAADGSAYFKVPAGTPVYLQALDENYCEVRRMRTSFTVQRGEFRGCTGCHESRLEAVGTLPVYPRETLARGPQTPEPPPWGDAVLDYRAHVQPIFDRNCASCHGETNPAGGLDFTAREIGGFAQSYRMLFGLKPGDPTPVRTLEYHLALHPEAADARYNPDEAGRIHQQMQRNTWPGQLVAISDRLSAAEITQPYQFGSNRSRLIRVLLDDERIHVPIRRQLPPEEWLALVTWLDGNANYHSTLLDKSSYARTKTIRRVPYELPSVWVPGDRSPLFLNAYAAPRAPAP